MEEALGLKKKNPVPHYTANANYIETYYPNKKWKQNQINLDHFFDRTSLLGFRIKMFRVCFCTTYCHGGQPSLFPRAICWCPWQKHTLAFGSLVWPITAFFSRIVTSVWFFCLGSLHSSLIHIYSFIEQLVFGIYKI